MNIQDFLDLFNPTFDGIVIGLLLIIVLMLTWRIWLPLFVGSWYSLKREKRDIEDTVDDLQEEEASKEGRPK